MSLWAFVFLRVVRWFVRFCGITGWLGSALHDFLDFLVERITGLSGRILQFFHR